MNIKKIISSLSKIFPKHFIEDFAVSNTNLAGSHSVAIEDHLQVVHGLSAAQIEDVRKEMFINSIIY
jgi:hypothetical protein